MGGAEAVFFGFFFSVFFSGSLVDFLLILSCSLSRTFFAGVGAGDPLLDEADEAGAADEEEDKDDEEEIDLFFFFELLFFSRDVELVATAVSAEVAFFAKAFSSNFSTLLSRSTSSASGMKS